MKQELIAPAARIAVALLQREGPKLFDLTPEVIGSAFETAYRGLQEGIQRVEQEEKRQQQAGGDDSGA